MQHSAASFPRRVSRISDLGHRYGAGYRHEFSFSTVEEYEKSTDDSGTVVSRWHFAAAAFSPRRVASRRVSLRLFCSVVRPRPHL